MSTSAFPPNARRPIRLPQADPWDTQVGQTKTSVEVIVHWNSISTGTATAAVGVSLSRLYYGVSGGDTILQHRAQSVESVILTLKSLISRVLSVEGVLVDSVDTKGMESLSQVDPDSDFKVAFDIVLRSRVGVAWSIDGKDRSGILRVTPRGI